MKTSRTILALALSLALSLGACTPARSPEPAKPLVIAHRGLSGRFPEETRSAYEAAARAGADALEMDLHLSRDCVLVARHNLWLSDNTSIAAVAAAVPEVAARRRTVVVDGEPHANDWAISDFTLAELRRWVRGTTYDNAAERPSALNGTEPVMSFQEIIDIARAHGLIVYPETKNPAWNNAEAIANGCGAPGSRPLEDALLKILRDNGLHQREAPALVQSFDPASLKYLRTAGLQTRLVQLIGGRGVDYRSGEVTGMDEASRAMLTPAGLAGVKAYADGIGPWKAHVMSWRIVPPRTGSQGSLAQVNQVTPKRLVADAHAAGLFVHVYTFRDERRYLPGLYDGDAGAELVQYLRAGVDGVFSDFADTAVAVRSGWLREPRR